MSSFAFKLWIVQTAMHKGNAFIEIERNAIGQIINLWPIRDEHIVPYRLSFEPYELVYGVYPSKRPSFYMTQDEIIHVPNLFTKDGIVGQGILAYAYETMGIAKGSDKFANGLFSNSGMPSGILSTEGSLSEEAFDRLQASWKEQMGGRKTGSTAILEEGLSYSPVTFQPDHMQFLESRKFTVQEIARFTGISPQKLFDIEAQKYGNVEQDSLAFANDTVSPWTSNIESQINAKLLNSDRTGLEAKFELYDLFKADMKTRSSYFKDRMNTGSMTPNQIREAEGEVGYEGGDRYYIATNNYTPLDKMDELLDAQIAKGESNDNDNTRNPAPPPAETNAVDEAFVKFLESKSRDGK